jgi:DNA repair exonuclease SbcCD ATPase subunit
MKLTRLDLTAFRSFRNISLNTDAPRILIGGINGAGKSSIREAIKWTLTGLCQGLDAKGSGVEWLSPTGSGVLQTGVDLTGIGRIERQWTNHGHGTTFAVKGFTGTSTAQQAALYDKLHTSPAFLQACLDSGVFLALHHADAKALILELLDVRVVVEGVSYTLDQLASAYDKAFELRKQAKVVLKNLVVPDLPPDQPPYTVAKCQALLADRRASLEQLLQETGELAGRRRALEQQLANLQLFPLLSIPARTELEGRIEALEERLAIVDETPIESSPAAPTPRDVVHAAFTAWTASQGRLMGRSLQQHGELAFRAGAAWQQTYAAEARAPGTPLISEPGITAELDTLRRRLLADDTAKEQYALHSKLTADLESLGPIPQETQIAELRTRIAKGVDLLALAQRYETAVQARQTALEQRQQAEAEVTRLEALCEQLGPSGARVQALQNAIGPFEAAVNVHLEPFGWTIHFEFDPWRVLANDRPLTTYSRSEQYRIGIALQLAIAAQSGLNFAIVDEIDMLDAENRSILGKMLYQSPLEQIFLLSTREPTLPLPALPNMVAVRLGKQGQQSEILEEIRQ